MGFSTAAHRNLIPRKEDAIVQLDSQINMGTSSKNKLRYDVVQPSDEVANGDSAEDKEISDTDDVHDHNVQDMGFSTAAHRNLIPRNESAIVQLKSNIRYTVEKPSDEFANGDSAEDKEISDTDDVHDHNVQDMGFSTAAHRNLIPRKDDAIVQLGQKLRYTVEKPSDEFANGDSAEDKEISDTDDVNDHNVQDMGFSTAAHRNLIPRKEDAIVQLSEEEKKKEQDTSVGVYMKNLEKKQAKLERVGQYGKELSDGDRTDDLELDDNDDERDVNVDENGYLQISAHLVLHHKPHGVRMIKDMMNVAINQYSDELANGDSADNKDIHEDEDMNDDVVDVNGQTNRGYGSRVPSKFEEGNLAGNFNMN